MVLVGRGEVFGVGAHSGAPMRPSVEAKVRHWRGRGGEKDRAKRPCHERRERFRESGVLILVRERLAHRPCLSDHERTSGVRLKEGYSLPYWRRSDRRPVGGPIATPKSAHLVRRALGSRCCRRAGEGSHPRAPRGPTARVRRCTGKRAQSWCLTLTRAACGLLDAFNEAVQVPQAIRPPFWPGQQPTYRSQNPCAARPRG